MKKHRLFKYLFTLVILTNLAIAAIAQGPSNYYVHIRTAKGESILKLYNETPKHRDNFVKLVKQGYYDSLMFHRVIRHFMIQGGDPGSELAVPGQQIGSGGPDYKIPAEIVPELIHKRGAIGAARDNNPSKESSGSQFYLVQGRVFSEQGLDSLETIRLKTKLSPSQRSAYTTVGGAPHLDGQYTVFGELVKGLEVIDRIAEVETDERDRPLEDQRMFLRMLKRSEALKVENGDDYVEPKRPFLKRIFGKKPAEDYILEQ